jgi:hypothetical protein
LAFWPVNYMCQEQMTRPNLFQSIHNFLLTHNRWVITYSCLEISHEVLTFESKISPPPHGSYIGPSLHVQFCVSSELFWTCSRITHLPHSCFPLSNTIHNNIQYWRRPQLHPALQQNMASISNSNKLHDTFVRYTFVVHWSLCKT